MSLIVPISVQVAVLTDLLSADLKLRLYSNRYNPSPNSVIGSFTEVVGGGYVAKDLLAADWVLSNTSPVIATQPTPKTFSFTGVTNAPGTVYGYYVTDVTGTVLKWAEALPGAYYPFTPVNTAYVRIFPYLAISGGQSEEE